MNVGIPMAWTAFSQAVPTSALILAAGTWSCVFPTFITSLLANPPVVGGQCGMVSTASTSIASIALLPPLLLIDRQVSPVDLGY